MTSIFRLRANGRNNSQHCSPTMLEKFDRFKTLRSNMKQHVTGCANGRNM